MVLLIDTSSARSGIAVLSEAGEPQGELVSTSGPDFDLEAGVRQLVDPQLVTKVGVATGPGSFTGLRVGVAYALGLAMSRRIPLHGLPTLRLAAARANVPATGVSEAGRGRLYFLPEGGTASAGRPEDLPADAPATGWLKDTTAEAVRAAGRTLLGEEELRPFGDAAWLVFRGSPELPYARVKLEYMHSIAGVG